MEISFTSICNKNIEKAKNYTPICKIDDKISDINKLSKISESLSSSPLFPSCLYLFLLLFLFVFLLSIFCSISNEQRTTPRVL